MCDSTDSTPRLGEGKKELLANGKPVRHPVGKLLLRTLALPADTNPSGDIFGGWLMSQMDMAGGILAHELAMGRIVTVAVDAMTFMTPLKVRMSPK